MRATGVRRTRPTRPTGAGRPMAAPTRMAKPTGTDRPAATDRCRTRHLATRRKTPTNRGQQTATRTNRTGFYAPYGPGEAYGPTHGSDAAYRREDPYGSQGAYGSDDADGTDATFGPGPAGNGPGGHPADGGHGPGGHAAERAGPDHADKTAKPGTALALRNEPPARRPVTDAETELAEFAKDLRELRITAGLGYPEMAELSHYTMKTLAAAAGGLNLPTLPVTAAYVRACDGNVAEWEDRWHRVADATKARDGGTPEPGRAADGAAGGSAPGGAGAGPAGKRASWKRAGQRRPAGHSVRRTGRSARPAAVPGCLPTSGPGGAVRAGSCSAASTGSRAGAGLRHHVRRAAAPLPVSSAHGHRVKPGKTTPSVLRPCLPRPCLLRPPLLRP